MNAWGTTDRRDPHPPGWAGEGIIARAAQGCPIARKQLAMMKGDGINVGNQSTCATKVWR